MHSRGRGFLAYILVLNPNPAAATASYKYFLSSGVVITRAVTVPANSRRTVAVESVEPLLENAAVSTQVTSNRPIVSERAMYWDAGGMFWAAGTNATAARLP